MRQDGDVDWSVLHPVQAGLRCVIVIPARDEAALLPRALQAIAAQRGVTAAYEVIVLANNCSDDTAARAREFAQRCKACAIHVVEVRWPPALANVGRARRALMEIASARLLQSCPVQGVICSTDADTCVAGDWLFANLMAIDAGADAVGGRIVAEVDDALPPMAQQLMRLDDSYRSWRARLESLVDPDPFDPWPRHHQHFGASLAVNAAAYRAVGGLPLVHYLEDEALVRALRLQDKSVRHCPRVHVHTSARLDGRVEVGLSWQLRAWSSHASADAYPPVVNPKIELQHWAMRRRTRALWRETSAPGSPALEGGDNAGTELARLLGIDCRWLSTRVSSCSSFGQLWDDIERYWGRAGLVSSSFKATVPMDEALRELRHLVTAQPAFSKT